MLAPTPPEYLTDARGIPYFLWDVQMTLDEYLERCTSGPIAEQGYWMARVLRDAKPDDAIAFFGIERIVSMWPHARAFVGRQRDFWVWYLGRKGHEVAA